MTIKLSSKGGSGGQPAIRTLSGLKTIAAGASGTILSLTPPAGQRAAITALTCDSLVGNIDIEIGGNPIVTGLTLAASAQTIADRYCLNSITQSTTGSVRETYPIWGGIDETIEIKVSTGSTANIIRYSYQFGE